MKVPAFKIALVLFLGLASGSKSFATEVKLNLEPYYQNEIDRVNQVGKCFFEDVAAIEFNDVLVFIPDSYIQKHGSKEVAFSRINSDDQMHLIGGIYSHPYIGKHSLFERGIFNVKKEYEKFGLQFVIGEPVSGQPENILLMHDELQQVVVLEYRGLIDAIESQIYKNEFLNSCKMRPELLFRVG